MKRNYGISVCCFLCLLVCQTATHALGHPDPELPNLVQRASTVCIGRVTRIEDIGPAQVNLGYRDSITNQPAPTAATNAVAEVSVQTVLKGKIRSKSITVAFYKNVHQGSTPTFFTELAVGETDVLFLETTGDETRFILSQPNTNGKSKINIGTAALKTPAEATPLRNVLSALANALADNSKAARLDCLQQIGSIGFVLNLKPGDPNYSVVIDLMKSLNEPGAPELKSFVNSRILPPVLKLMTDADAEVRQQAVYTAGRLQDVDVLPTLGEMANKEAETGMGSAAMIVGEYKAPEAVRPLVRLLESKNDDVRHEAAVALRNIADPLAVPFLLEHLDDPNPWARYYIVTALYTAIDPSQCPGPVLFHDDEDKHVSFWKKWAADHQDKVAALREQFLSPLPLKATH